MFPAFMYTDIKYFLIRIYYWIIINLKWELNFLKNRIHSWLFLKGFVKNGPRKKQSEMMATAILDAFIENAKLNKKLKDGQSEDSDSVPNNGTGEEI